MGDLSGSTQYLAEVFAPQYTTEQLGVESERVREAVQAASRSDEPVRYLRSLLIPGEETAFFFFEALHTETIERVLHAAGVDPDRISTVIPNAEHDCVSSIDPDRSRTIGSVEYQRQVAPRSALSSGEEGDG